MLPAKFVYWTENGIFIITYRAICVDDASKN